MSRISKLVIVMMSAGLFSLSFAQMAMKFKGSDGWGLQGRYEQSFNNFNLETFSGQVLKIDTITPLRDMAYGVQLTVKKGPTEVFVHLGPAWYILHQDMVLQIKDNVEIKGCNAVIEGKQVYMAVVIKNLNDRKYLYLRDKDGYPYWCAYRKE